MRKLLAYEADLKAGGGRVPAMERAPDRPYMTCLAKQLKIPQSVLSQAPHRQFLQRLGDRFGFEPVHLYERHNANVLIKELKLLKPSELEWQAVGLLQKTERDPLFAALITRLTEFEADGDKADAKIALARFLDPARQALACDGDVHKIAKLYADHLSEQFDPADALPNDTRARIRICLDRRGMKLAELQRKIGWSRIGLKEIIAGARRFTPNDELWLQAAEQVLQVAAGSLRRDHQFGRRGIGQPSGVFPADGPQLTEAQKAKLALYLPQDFQHQSQDEKLESVEVALEMIAASVSPERAARARLQEQAYALKGRLPGNVIDEEPVAVTVVKPADVTDEDPGGVNSKTPADAQDERQLPDWVFCEIEDMVEFYSNPFTKQGDKNPRPPWSVATIKIRVNFVLSILGFLTSEQRGAAAIPRNDLSMALLVSSDLVYWYLDFRAKRRQKTFAEIGLRNIPEFTEEYIGILEFLKVLVDPNNGWLTQRPGLKASVRTVEATQDERAPSAKDARLAVVEDERFAAEDGWLLGPKRAAAAAADWRSTCGEAHAAYVKLIANQRRKVAQSRDSHGAIKAILQSDKPMQAMTMAFNGLKEELCQVERGTLAYAEILRDLLAIGIEMQTGFRRRTLLALDWDKNNRSDLRFIDGRWHLYVSRQKFKNPSGDYFVTGYDDAGHRIYGDYRRCLNDCLGLYGYIDAYLKIYRPMLLGARQCSALMIGSRNSLEPRLRRPALDQLCRRIFVRHLIENPLKGSGFKGVFMSGGWHAWRHIIATAMLKRTGSYSLAGDAIQDSADMAKKTYASYLTQDREKALFAAWEACIADAA